MKKSVLSFGVVILSFLSLGQATAAGWVDDTEILKIALEHRNDENDIYLTLDSVLNTTCPYKDIVTLAADSEGKLNRLYSTVLAAKLSSKTISVYVSDECNNDGRPKSFYIKLD